jgi:hypothetical protein
MRPVRCEITHMTVTLSLDTMREIGRHSQHTAPPRQATHSIPVLRTHECSSSSKIFVSK